MNPALWVAKTGLDAQQVRMNVIANNLIREVPRKAVGLCGVRGTGLGGLDTP